jgi:hypothetical protein
VAELSGEDLERLGSRIALLVSEPGEADNAGRAVAALARRMGLTGGQLKDFVITGALQDGHRLRRPRTANEATQTQVDQLERELSAMRHGLKLTEVQARNAVRERDALRAENGVLLDALDRARTTGQVRQYIGIAALAAAVVAGIVVYAGPDLRPVPEKGRGQAERPDGSPFLQGGVVRKAGANLFKEPEVTAQVLTQLPGGARVQVRQVVWRAMVQWMEVEIGNLTGYMLSTDIERV